MLAAAHFDNFLFLIFVAVAILFQILARAAGKTGRRSGDNTNRRAPSSPQTPRQTSRQLDETEEDRVRKFLEALGQPTTSKPPPPVATRPTYQKPIVLPRAEPRPMQRRVLSPLPPLTTRPPDLPSESVSERVPTLERKVFKPRTEIPAFEVHAVPPPLAPITEPEVTTTLQPASAQPVSKSEGKIGLATLLKSSSGLRNAIVLREIFGPPRSLQPLDPVGNV